MKRTVFILISIVVLIVVGCSNRKMKSVHEQEAEPNQQTAPQQQSQQHSAEEIRARIQKLEKGKRKLEAKSSSPSKSFDFSNAEVVGYLDNPMPVYIMDADNSQIEMLRRSVDDDYNTEEYKRIYDNSFLNTIQNPVSTFSIDVDVASYANVRRFLNDNRLPPADAVRIEEFINYFKYEYAAPEDDIPFALHTEVSVCPWNPNNRILKVGIKGKEIATEQLPPSNLVFLLDVSGSMENPNKLPLLQKAFRLLVNELREQDKVSIVVYAGSAGLVLPPTSGSDKEKILTSIDKIQAGGSTAGGEGILLAYKIAKENFVKGGINRIVLATDGDFNVGVSSEAELTRLIEQKRKEGIFLTVLGFGSGNYKDSKMEQLADKGNGNYAYIDNILEAQKVLVNEMGATLATIAKE